MKKVILITGFNNWGKTTIINHPNLFSRTNYEWGKLYSINTVNSKFVVENHSNDDYLGLKWIDRLKERIRYVNENPANRDTQWNLFSAICPSLETKNNFINLLNDPFFEEYEKHLFLIKYKWEHHAELMLKNIQSVLPQTPNLFSYVIDQDVNVVDPDQRRILQTAEIKRILQGIFP